MKRLSNLILLVKDYYSGSDPAHDWAHVGRVAKNAEFIADNENVNFECVLAAVYCHDLVNLPKDDPNRKHASTFSAKEARPFLIRSGFDASEIEEISRGIVEHSFSKGLKPSNLTAAIVQDADRLDALGAIGILRCAAVTAQMKSKFYDSFDPLAEMRELDDKTFMLDHYFVKLFKLPELMNTDKGRELAQRRVEGMKDFIQTLMQEIK
ncbi:MAG TPA: HD domain-containing protein [Bacteriovoracaceae bacterium]|nr:HD domain-containing protein [Bacteriovoracaceae bacterium]